MIEIVDREYYEGLLAEAKQEIERLQVAKREFSKLADERAIEANGLRVLLKQARQFVHDSECDGDDADVSQDRDALLRKINDALTDEEGTSK